MTYEEENTLEKIRHRDYMDWHYMGRGPRWTQEQQDRRDLLKIIDEMTQPCKPLEVSE